MRRRARMKRPARALAGFMGQQEGIALLNDAALPDAAQLPALTSRWQQLFTAVQARTNYYKPESPIAEPPQDVIPLLESARIRNDLQQAFAQNSWTVEWIDLTKHI